MSEVSPRKGSAVWVILLTVVAAWAACGAYRWRVPPLVEARAIVQVPPATDLESMCQQPDLQHAAARKLHQGNAPSSPTEQPGDVQLSGGLTVRKLENTARTGSPETALPLHATETWELTYRTNQPDRALNELAALAAAVEQRLASSAETGLDVNHHDDSSLRIQELEDECLEAELELEALSDPEPPAQDVGDLSSPGQMTPPTPSLGDGQSELLRMESEWQLVQNEFASQPDLETIAARLSPGPLHEALLQLDRQRKLSLELTRLNSTEQRLSDIYGDRHPKLIEVRRKFDQVLTELGGWDEVVDDQHLPERLQSTGQAVIALQQQQVDDLQLQSELEQEQSATTDEATRQRSLLTRQLAKLKQELATAEAASADDQTTKSTPPLFANVQKPHLVSTPWYFSFGVQFALATVCGLIAGQLLYWSWPESLGVDEADLDLPPTPSFVPAPEARLDLAQRRAVRQARLQQAYAG